MKLHSCFISLLDALSGNCSILYRNVICPLSLADVNQVFLLVIFQIFSCKRWVFSAAPGQNTRHRGALVGNAHSTRPVCSGYRHSFRSQNYGVFLFTWRTDFE